MVKSCNFFVSSFSHVDKARAEWLSVKLYLQVTIFNHKMPVKITKDEFGVTADGKHVARFYFCCICLSCV